MLTLKSILTGALVIGAATVPAGVVVTEFAVERVPAAPGAIAAEAPTPITAGGLLDARLHSAVLVPPAPARVIDARAPDLAVPTFAEVTLVTALPLPPRPEPVSGVAGPVVETADPATAEAGLRFVPIPVPG